VLATPVAVGRFEVTVGEFRRFLAAAGHAAGGNCFADSDGDGRFEPTPDASWANPGFEPGDQSPVACVTWDDAQAYVTWLSRSTGETYRLLSESEWEYAARAGTTTAYSWGAEPNSGCAYSNGGDASAKRQQANWTTSTCDDGVGKRTAEAGRYGANDFGLFDMHGNVGEWVEDCYTDSYAAGQPSDGSAFRSDPCSGRVSRGGSWYSSPRILRSASRSGHDPADRYNDLGFRVARTLSSTP
jgi:formylglycine-generating enzyme required for sulfatase activity